MNSQHDDDSELLSQPEEADTPQSAVDSDYRKLETSLGYAFSNRSWLESALTHRSARGHGDRGNYERLEFLGDAVLDLGVAELLLRKYPDAAEGELSKMRAALVNTNSLAEIARAMQVNLFIRVSRSEAQNGGTERPSILADVFEAIIGAIYRDGGFNQALSFIQRFFAHLVETVTPHDPKTELQELLHAGGLEPPVYKLECVEGPEHAPCFVSLVEVCGRVSGHGRGATKKASQQMAAAEALKGLARQSTQPGAELSGEDE